MTGAGLLLLVHGLLAIGLLGAVTHQLLAVWRRPGTRPAAAGFLTRAGGVQAALYTGPTVLLYTVNFLLGAALYASYRLEVRPLLEDLNLLAAAGAFEAKEHIAALGFGLLPVYAALWRDPGLAGQRLARRIVTSLLAFFVWWDFLIGHIVNNIKGL
jgi:hypothetical protein